MKPGRELYALIAERVMGWRLRNYETGEYSNDWANASVSDGWEWEGRDSAEEAWKWGPSRKISDAWEVWEHVGRDECLILTKFMDRGSWKWEANVNGVACGPLADTAPHAICLAALKTVTAPTDAEDEGEGGQ
jgi:hypothetical protein